MKINIILATCIILLIPVCSGAQVYKYYDENNQLCFTDDYSMVPENQRSKVKAIPGMEKKTIPPSNEKDNQDQDTAEQDNIDQPEPSQNNQVTAEKESEIERPDAEDEALKQEFLELSQLKAKLDQQYNDLKTTQQALSKTPEKAVSVEQVNEHNKKAEELNNKIAQYKKEYKAYNERLNRYNKKAADMR